MLNKNNFFDLYISSMDDDYYDYKCHIYFCGKIVKLPEIVKPLILTKPYHEIIPRKYGISIMWDEGFIQIYRGLDGDNTKYKKTISFIVPWKNYSLSEDKYYNLKNDEYMISDSLRKQLKTDFNIDMIPHLQFKVLDFDGEEIIATIYKISRTWRVHNKFLRLFFKPITRYILEIEFNKETGKEKGSWKGGTTATGIDTTLNEGWVDAFKRYCQENELTILN